MGPKLKILNTVIERLNERKSPFLGELYGVLFDNTLIILSFTLRYIEEQNESKYQISENNLPTEIDLYGVVNCKQNLPTYSNSLPQDIRTIFQDVVVSDNPVLLSYGYLEKDANIQAYFYKNGAVSLVNYDIISEAEMWQKFVIVHLKIPVNFICCNKPKDKEEYLIKFTKKVSSGAAMFHIDNSDIFLTSNNAKGLSNGDNVANMLCNQEPEITPLTMHINKIAPDCSKIVNVINVNMLMKTTSNKSTDFNDKQTLTIQHATGNIEIIQGCLQLSSLIMFQKNRGERHLYNALVDSVCRIMKLTKRSFFINESIFPEIHHFYPTRLGHFVTLVYPSNVNDEILSDVRKYVHSKFNLPCDKPLFRRGITYFSQSNTIGPQLRNVHVGLAPSGVNGNVSLVQGNYLYYHYLQDNTNDNGWGCAYRSLQTIFSWFKLQGWTDLNVPSLKDIQQTLVDIQDKPTTFVGSKQWIGSVEVSFVLETLINVTGRLLQVQVGESLNDIAHELSNHFKKHGTPVMIGGGVLAHTILGVDINDENDEVKFLVLDPHYTGTEQLSQIQNKGWVGWKDADFWKKNTFYNLCLPYCKMGV